MRTILLAIWLVWSGLAQAQEYRLAYEPDDMPELYHGARVYAEAQQADGSYKRITSGYRIRSTDGMVQGNNRINYTPTTLYNNNGVLHCTLQINGKDIPLTIAMPVLTTIRFNLYTDSIKPVLNYYVNVEGTYSSGRILPLDTTWVRIAADNGAMAGNEWVVPKQRPIPYEKVHFTAVCLYNEKLRATTTIYIKKLVTD